MEQSKKRANFEKIAQRRKEEINKKILSLSNLNNKSFYDYDKKEIKDLFKDIETTLNITKNQLLNNKKPNNNFSLNPDIKIKLSNNNALKISIMINNLFIKDFFNVSEQLNNIYDFKELLELKELMITLKSLIDIELDKTE